MEAEIDESWRRVLKNEFNSAYFKEIKLFLSEEKQKDCTIYPEGKHIFEAFNATPFNKVKVVIIGQDPYHGKNQAHGLSFSVQKGIQHPPSLINIFKEITQDLNLSYPKHGDLTRWAKQGVLLLNATLTVRKSEANSHQKIGWQKFTDAVIKIISEERDDIIFLLWGGFAKKKGAKINSSKHHILTSGHPSPLSANRGFWFGNKHFSKTNEILRKKGLTEIDWQIK